MNADELILILQTHPPDTKVMVGYEGQVRDIIGISFQGDREICIDADDY